MSRSGVFVQQQAIYRFRYYFENWLPTRESPQYGLPPFEGFVTYELEPIPATGGELVRREGRLYHVEEIRVALFPVAPGAREIGPTELVLPAYGGHPSRTLRTRPVRLTVVPLPEPRPEDFSGAVGEFQQRARLVEDQVGVNEPIRLRVTIAGRGNLNAWTLSPPVEVEAATLYDPTVSVQWDVVGEQVGGTKTYEYVIVPQRSGRATVRVGGLSYFSPSQGHYRRTESAVLTVQVSSAPSGPETPSERRTVAPPRTGRDSGVWWLLLGGLGVALLGVALWAGRRHARPAAEASSALRARSERRGLDDLRPEDYPDAREFCKVLSERLGGEAAVLLGMSPRSALVEVVQRLQEDGSAEAQALLDALREAQAGGFAPVALSPDEIGRLYRRAEKALSALAQARGERRR
ncbi:MAG: hypothetical protein KatS3mg115_2136 [Candidatus Poribacteria bacterium]|nr:MAG: hypothetical protein KatS3mg115_2136 [Candidatus Poribacteria bacterium]